MPKKNPLLEKLLHSFYRRGRTIDQTYQELQASGRPVPRSTIGYHFGRFRSNKIPQTKGANDDIDILQMVGIALIPKAIIVIAGKINQTEILSAQEVAQAYKTIGELLVRFHGDLAASGLYPAPKSILLGLLRLMRTGEISPAVMKALENIHIKNEMRLISSESSGGFKATKTAMKNESQGGNTLSDLIDKWRINEEGKRN